MKTILDLATSVDGFIAKKSGDSDWVSPKCETPFIERIKSASCLIVGRTTFEQYQGSIYPVADALNIVLTSDPSYSKPGVVSAISPLEAIELAKKYGAKGIVIAGGSRTSTAFLEANLIDEVFLSVHPLLLGQGMNPFHGIILEKRMRFVTSTVLEDGVIVLHYEIIK